MASILVKDFLYRASTLLLDTRPQFTRFKERELVMWLNDGQRAIAKYLPYAYSRTDVVKLVAGSKQSIANIPANRIIMGDGTTSIAMRGNSLIGISRNMGLDGATAGKAVSVIQGAMQDAIDSNWHSNNGYGYIEHYIYQPVLPKDFYVTPAVSSVINTWVELMYMAAPIELAVPATDVDTLYTAGAANENATLILDDQYLDDLINYVMARCYMKDAEYAANQGLAMMYTNMFSQSINANSMAVLGLNPNLSFLPFAPTPIASAK